MIIIYTGPGKGKTCACVGQALRALGHGLRVVFLQFFKRADVAGEQRILQNLLGSSFRADGLGFFRSEEQREAHSAHARDLLHWAEMQVCDMLILDEALYALGARLIGQEDLEPLLQKYRNIEKILVLSGRGLPPWLEHRSDIITAMEATRHVYASGTGAGQGVEY